MKISTQALALVLTATVVAAVASRYSAPAPAPDVPNVVARTQDDRRVRVYDDIVRGRVVLLNFMFTSCTSFCPGATANLARLQPLLGDHLGRDVVMISVSVDPQHDTPARLKAYAERFGARGGWYFLRVAQDDVTQLQRRFRLREPEDDPADLNTHTGVLVYGSDRRGIWRTALVLKKPPDLAREVLALLE